MSLLDHNSQKMQRLHMDSRQTSNTNKEFRQWLYLYIKGEIFKITELLFRRKHGKTNEIVDSYTLFVRKF